MLSQWIPPGKTTLADHPGYLIAIDVLDQQSRLQSDLFYVGLDTDECLHLTNWLACVRGFSNEAFTSDAFSKHKWLTSEFGFGESDISLLLMIVWRHSHEQRQHHEAEVQESERKAARHAAVTLRQQDRRLAAEEAAKAVSLSPMDVTRLYEMMSSVAGQVARLDQRICDVAADSLSAMPFAVAKHLAKAARDEAIALERAKATTARNEAKLLDAKRKRDEAAHRRAIELVPPQVTVIQMTPEDIARASDNRRVYRRF